MKSQVSCFELHFLVKELQQIVGSRVDKIYNPSKEEVIITLHIPNKGQAILRILAGKCLYLSESREPAEEPTNFCLFLRKHLAGSRMREITQLQPERIVKIAFEKKDSKATLIAELFGRGNIILTNGEDMILSATDYHKFRDRTIRPKEKYSYPQKGVNVFELSNDVLKKAVESTQKDSTVTFLAVDLGMGGTFAEEMCVRSNIDKSKPPKSVAKNEIDAITTAIKKIINAPPQPNIVRKGNTIVEALPIRLNIFSDCEAEDFDSFSSAIENSIASFQGKKVSAKEQEIQRLMRIVESQEEKVRELEQLEAENRQKGELIFENYQLIAGIIKELGQIEKKHSWHEIKDKLKGHRLIKDVDVREKKIVIEVPKKLK